MQDPTTSSASVAQDFELPDSAGQTRKLSEIVRKEPAVLLFYRGNW